MESEKPLDSNEKHNSQEQYIGGIRIWRRSKSVSPVWAFTVQKLKVEGNIDKALRLKDIIEIKQKQLKKEQKEKEKQEKLVKKVEKKKK